MPDNEESATGHQAAGPSPRAPLPARDPSQAGSVLSSPTARSSCLRAIAGPESHRPTLAGIALAAVVLCFAAVFPGSRGWTDDPIWKYDLRDVFYDVAFPHPQQAVIVGARGRVLVMHGRYPNLWSPRESGTKELLTCLSFANEKEGWAAGHGGIVLHTKDAGRSWEILRESRPDSQPLFDIQFLSPQEGFACGAFDTFLKTTDGGRTWQSLPPGLDTMYNGMAFFDTRNGFLAGEFGTVLRTSDGGLSWEKLDLGDRQGSWFGILVLSRDEILVFGIAGALRRSPDGGRTWVSVPSGTDRSLFRGAARNDEVLLVGASGTILSSSDRGKTFTLHRDEELTTFAGVCAHPALGFLCVGETGKIEHLGP